MLFSMPIIYFTNGFDNIFKGTIPATYVLFLVVIQIVVFIALNGKLLLNKGQTIGKMVLNIKIVTLTGELPSVKQHLIKRFGVYLLTSQIPFIGQFLSMINAKPFVKYIMGMAIISMISASSSEAHNLLQRLAKTNSFSIFSSKEL
jgi:hypothetical protein